MVILICCFTPYAWSGGTVARILEKPEYMGDTVNFRTHKKSYKDKKQERNGSGDIMVFRDTHEPLTDRRTWYMVQELRKTVRRTDADGEASMLTGKIFCADCGAKMYRRRAGKRASRDWRGIPDGGVEDTPAVFNCSTYNNSRKRFSTKCCSHSLKEENIKLLILETIRHAIDSARMDEDAFMEGIRSASEIRDKGEEKKLKAALARQEKRSAELDMLLKKVYEDNAMGRLPDRRYEMLSAGYEQEQMQLEADMAQIREKLAAYEENVDRGKEFLSLVHKYTEVSELTPVIVNEFVDRVMVHKREDIDGERVQEIEIYLNFIGRVELPAMETSPEEAAMLEKDRERRRKRAAYLRDYRAKRRAGIRRVIDQANESAKMEKIGNARESAEALISSDGAGQVASMVAGENKVAVEGELLIRAEAQRKYGKCRQAGAAVTMGKRG